LAARAAHSPERRGILSGQVFPADQLIRIVRDPDGRIVPDIAHKLPGRGAWLEPDRAAIEAAHARNKLTAAIARSLKAPVRPDQLPEDFTALLDRLLAQRCLNRLGLARKAGALITGFDQVAEALQADRVGVVIHATDGAADGIAKLARMNRGGAPVLSLFTRAELSLALGRENVVHAALARGGGAGRLLADAHRLALFRGLPQAAGAQQEGTKE